MSHVLAERTYRTADWELCAEDDPRAAFLVGGVGTVISDDDATRLGLKSLAPAEDKAMVPAEDKAIVPPAKRGRKEVT